MLIDEVREALLNRAEYLEMLLNPPGMFTDYDHMQKAAADNLRAIASRLEGMAIVPVEPTEAQIDAADRKVNACTFEVYAEEITDIYRAMLAAVEDK